MYKLAQHEQTRRNVIHNPIDALDEAIAGHRAATPNRRVAVVEYIDPRIITDSEHARNFAGTECPEDVLFVGQNEQARARQLLLLKQVAQLRPAHFQPCPVGAVDDPDQAVGLLEVISPVCTYCLLPSNIPAIQFVTLVLQGFDVESKRWFDGVDALAAKLPFEINMWWVEETVGSKEDKASV